MHRLFILCVIATVILALPHAVPGSSETRLQADSGQRVWIVEVDATYDDLLTEADVSLRKLSSQYNWETSTRGPSMTLYVTYESPNGELRVFRMQSSRFGSAILNGFILRQGGKVWRHAVSGTLWHAEPRLPDVEGYMVLFYERWKRRSSLMILFAGGSTAKASNALSDSPSPPSLALDIDPFPIFIARFSSAVLPVGSSSLRPLRTENTGSPSPDVDVKSYEFARRPRQDWRFFSRGYDHLVISQMSPEGAGLLRSAIAGSLLKEQGYLRSPLPIILQEYQIWNAEFPPPPIVRISKVDVVEAVASEKLYDFIDSIEWPEALFCLEFGLRDGSYLLVLMKGQEVESADSGR